MFRCGSGFEEYQIRGALGCDPLNGKVDFSRTIAYQPNRYSRHVAAVHDSKFVVGIGI